MTGEPLGLQWATQSYEDAAIDVDNSITLADRDVARRVARDAFRVCRETLGVQWLAREGSAALSGGFLMLDGPESAYLGPDAAIESMSRLFDLARELHEARHVRGFEHLLPDLRSRSLYEALAELRAVNHMVRAGDDAWFVQPSASGGKSFDAMVVLCGIEVAVEVKVKRPKPLEEYRPALIINSLSKARKQLPAAGPSLIYLQLASPWTDDPATMSSVDETIKSWLTRTGRVNGVLVMAERLFRRGESGTSRMRGSFYISNLAPRHLVEQL